MKEAVDAADLIKLVEDHVHHVPRLLIGIEVHLARRQDRVAHRNAMEQFAPQCLVVAAALQAVAHDVQFHFTHDAFEPQQEPIVRVVAVIDAVLVGDQRAEDGAHLEEGVPILRRPRQAAHLQPQHQADVVERHFGGQPLKSAASFRRATALA